MKLSLQDTLLFYELMAQLGHYANRQLKIFPAFDTFEKFQEIDSEERFEIRTQLYENIDLIDKFIAENPANLSQEELQIVLSWKKFHKGKFFIERHLKKYSVFIDDDKVYAVLALQDSFEDILPKTYLPSYVEAVLLPFKGAIIYDGFLARTNIFFGSNHKASLKEIYLSAKQKGQIIESFDPAVQKAKQAKLFKPNKDYRPLLEEISKHAKKLRSGGNAPAVYSPAFSLAKAGIDFARLAVENPDDLDALWKALRKIAKATARAETILYRQQ